MIYNWGIKKVLWVIIAIQISMLELVGLSALGFDIPILRQIIGFIYLTFIPGLLILRILKLDKLGYIEALLYSVGLSISFVMFIGFFMNEFYPLLGISKPISILPVLITITFITLILCVMVYKRGDLERESPSQDNPSQWSELVSPPALLLLLLPFLTILGTHLVYFHKNNILLLILLSLIVLIIVLITFDKFIPAKLYPMAIVAIAIALLWHWSLISPSLHGFDIHHEYWVQNQVISNSIWNHAYTSYSNAMLSVVMLAPIYSLMLNLDSVWIFKIVYPIFYSLVPLALYQAYRKQTDDKIAFLASFFFMSFPVFFSELTGQVRQPIAELFLTLTILLFLEKEMHATKRAALLIIFGLSIVVSHYSLSYFYMMFYLSMGLILLLLWKSNAVNVLWQRMVARFSKSQHRVDIALQRESTISVTYVILFIVFCVAWYIYVSSGSIFNAAIHIADHIYHSLNTELFSIEARDPHIVQALGLASMRSRDVEWSIARIFQYITQFFIIVGVLWLIANLRKTRFHTESVVMILISIVILAMCIVLPYFASYLNMSRIYHIALFFLSPLCILGGITTFQWLNRIFLLLLHHRRVVTSTNTNLKLAVIIVLVPYFLFGTGFVFELTGATPSSMPLALYKTDWSFFTEPEICATKWIGNVGTENFRIYSDVYGRTQLHQEFGGRSRLFPSQAHFYPPLPRSRRDSYIFLRRWNVVHNEMLLFARQGAQARYVDLKEGVILDFLTNKNKIYNSGTAQIIGPMLVGQ